MSTVIVNRGLKPGIDPCRHCGGLHFGSGFACPYLCAVCFKDIRIDAVNRCECLSIIDDRNKKVDEDLEQLRKMADLVAKLKA